MNKLISLAASVAIVNLAYADEVLPSVKVESLYEQIQKQGKVKDIVEKTEVVSKKQIEKEQAISLLVSAKPIIGYNRTLILYFFSSE